MARPGIITSRPVALDEHELYARLFRVLGDATRLRLLEHLVAAGRARQLDLIDVLDTSQSLLSQHMRILRWGGFIVPAREGRVTKYELYGDYVEQILRPLREFYSENEDAAGGCWVAGRDDPARRRP